MVVYIENVIADNFALTYLIARLSYKIGGVYAKKSRSVIASVVGTLSSLVYPFIKNNVILFLFKFALFLVLSVILYYGKKNRIMPFVFLAVTAAMGGVLFFIGFFVFGSVESILQGIYDFSPGAIIFSGWVIYKIAWKAKMSLVKKRHVMQFVYNVKIVACGNEINLKGLLDSGNGVYDEGTTLPIMLLWGEYKEMLCKNAEDEKKLYAGCTSITDIAGQKRRVLLFVPDKIEITTLSGECVENSEALVGIIDGGNVKRGEFGAILHPAMIKGGSNENNRVH